jgi:hypothetical protein
MGAVKVVAQYGVYHCSECLNALAFEVIRGSSLGACMPLDAAHGGHAVGYCANGLGRCSLQGVRLKIPLIVLEVDTLPPLEENPRDEIEANRQHSKRRAARYRTKPAAPAG